jgi:hypothetical protein
MTCQIFYACQILEKSGAVHELFIVLKKAYDSVGREVLYSILIEFVVIPRKLVGLIKMCLKESRVLSV